MSMKAVERDFRAKVSEEIRIQSEGVKRFRVFTPFRFDDGDHLVIVLKDEGTNWLLTDEGHTYMRLTYDIDETDLQKSVCRKLISDALSEFQIEDRNHEFVHTIRDQEYGKSLFLFVQAIQKIHSVSLVLKGR